MFFFSKCSCFQLTFLHSYDVGFIGMVIPGGNLKVKLRHNNMHGSIIGVSIIQPIFGLSVHIRIDPIPSA